MTWPSYNGGEDGSGCVIPSEASLAHSRAIVYHKGGNVVVTHVWKNQGSGKETSAPLKQVTFSTGNVGQNVHLLNPQQKVSVSSRNPEIVIREIAI